MPTVPKGMLDPNAAQDQPGLLAGKDTMPDATSILMAASTMRSLGKIGRGTGDTMSTPRRSKSSKATGRTRQMMR